MTEIRWHGRGGLGAFTAARLLGCAVSLFEGKYALAFPSFGPERRGAPVFAFTRIDDKASPTVARWFPATAPWCWMTPCSAIPSRKA